MPQKGRNSLRPLVCKTKLITTSATCNMLASSPLRSQLTGPSSLLRKSVLIRQNASFPAEKFVLWSDSGRCMPSKRLVDRTAKAESSRHMDAEYMVISWLADGRAAALAYKHWSRVPIANRDKYLVNWHGRWMKPRTVCAFHTAAAQVGTLF